MINKEDYKCSIYEALDDTSYIKGSIVDLRLNMFHTPIDDKELPYYTFDILAGGHHVGNISLRLGYNDEVIYTGQVGYDIDPLYQGYHYSYYALEMIKVLARKHGYSNILMTTETHNLASQKIIQYAHGVCVTYNLDVPKDHIYHVIGKDKINLFSISVRDAS